MFHVSTYLHRSKRNASGELASAVRVAPLGCRRVGVQ
jgi:hypothetical protein